MGKRKTDEEFKKEYYNKFPDTNVKILGKYEAMKKPIECICKKCNYEWSPLPNGIFNGSGCPKCSGTLKYTNESFKESYYNKFPDSNIIITGEYVNSRTNINCLCKVCDYKWETIPRNLMTGCGCPECYRNRKYTVKKFKKVYYEKFQDSNIEIVGTDIDSKQLIECKCNKCGWEWKPYIYNLLKKNGCPRCGKNPRYNTESFKKSYYEKFPDTTVEIVGEYTKAQNVIDCICKSCGYKWAPRAHHIMEGHSCPKCAKDNRILVQKTSEEFLNEYYAKYPNSDVKILGEYRGMTSPILCECKDCGLKWSAAAKSLLNGSGCTYCNGHMQYTTDMFSKKLNKKYPYNNDIIKSEYKGANKNIEVECGLCHKTWITHARYLMKGHRCPYCAIGRTEKSLGTFLDSLGISYTAQKKFDDCKDTNTLPFDYEINDERFTTFLLEYQGEQHERPIDWAGKGQDWAEKQLVSVKEHDNIKYNYCQKTGRHLEYIWYYEEDKIQALIDLLRKHIKPEYDLDEILANAKMNKTA